MSYTPNDIYNTTLAIMDEVDDSGDNGYKDKALPILNVVYAQMALIENVSDVAPLTSFTQNMLISDTGCMACAYYLAHHLATADMNDEIASMCGAKFNEYKRLAQKPLDAVEISDVYNLNCV